MLFVLVPYGYVVIRIKNPEEMTDYGSGSQGLRVSATQRRRRRGRWASVGGWGMMASLTKKGNSARSEVTADQYDQINIAYRTDACAQGMQKFVATARVRPAYPQRSRVALQALAGKGQPHHLRGVIKEAGNTEKTKPEM